MKNIFLSLNLCLLCITHTAMADETPLTPASVIEASKPSDWRQPAQSNLLHLQLENGEVIFELAPHFAPNHVANLNTLVNDKYFDGLAIIRSQDNYVAQWGDPNAGTDKAKSQGKAKAELEPEFYRQLEGLEQMTIESRDPYADQVGFSRGFTFGSDDAAGKDSRAWLTHCYGALGAGRGMAANSGNAAELYVVTGHAPRHLDRNVTLLGRAISGMELLSSLPRGTGTLGFYETPEEAVTIKAIRLGSQLPKDQQSRFEIMRTDTKTFASHVKSRTTRLNEWFLDSTGKIGVCNVGVPVREVTE
jgi:peptidylprolyl isomerase